MYVAFSFVVGLCPVRVASGGAYTNTHTHLHHPPRPAFPPTHTRTPDNQQLGDPDKIIAGFAPEIFGRPLQDGDVLETSTAVKQGITYYQW